MHVILLSSSSSRDRETAAQDLAPVRACLLTPTQQESSTGGDSFLRIREHFPMVGRVNRNTHDSLPCGTHVLTMSYELSGHPRPGPSIWGLAPCGANLDISLRLLLLESTHLVPTPLRTTSL